MRKLFTAILLGMLAFNWLGYHLVFAYLDAEISGTAQQRIDAGAYDRAQLLEIKVDLELPYTTDWADFEQVKGVVSYQGVMYNFVERKYEKGQMIYRCLPNYRGTELQNARDLFYSLAYDMEKQDDKKPAPKAESAKKLIVETTIIDNLSWTAPAPEGTTAFMSGTGSCPLDGFLYLPAEPPEA